MGRTAPLERDEIVACALEIVRAEGREALSMRRLAKELGVTPMGIYHHIPDKPGLMQALLDQVWRDIALGPPPATGDPIEDIIALGVRSRVVWLENFDLATLAVAVAEVDDELIEETGFHAAVLEAVGFPDVPLAYSAIQNFIMGAIQISANRRASSAYFGRDPSASLAKARRILRRRKVSENHLRLMEARFDEGDDAHFEPALRALIVGLQAG